VPVGALELRVPPGTPTVGVPALTADEGERPRLREATAYRYSVNVGGWDAVWLEPSELFQPDDDSRRTGRLLTGQSVGWLDVEIRRDPDSPTEAIAALEVRTSKLTYEREYRRMLSDIGTLAAEATVQGFAPTTQRFELDPAREASLLYQRFAGLCARLFDDELESALAYVLGQPHREWRDEFEERPPGLPVAGSSTLINALTASGPRVPAPTLGRSIGLRSLPRRLPHRRTEDTWDTVPNRFVRFALERWQSIALDLQRALARTVELDTGPARRGRHLAEQVATRLDELLMAPVLRDASELTSFPSGNQVLLKREGYRQIFEAYVLLEAALAVAVELPHDPLAVSQRTVSQLYEMWSDLVLVEVVAEIAGEPVPLAALFHTTEHGLSLALHAGQASALEWTLTHRGRRVGITLAFNRSFRVGEHATGSWTRVMRPDCSLRVRLLDAHVNPPDDVWLHFDAKYRLERLERFAPDETANAEPEALAADEEEAESTGSSKREDLLKMHAYRDAIRRSAAAYVLYPGEGSPTLYLEHGEVLPGLGAFPLRPSADGGAQGRSAIRKHLGDVLDHFASQITQHERSRYWRDAVFGSDPPALAVVSAAPFLERPPADVDVLLGFVRSSQHWEWIQRNSVYNVRAGDRRGAVQFGGRELAVDVVLLYAVSRRTHRTLGLFSRRGPWRVLTRADLETLGYPRPGGDYYFCAELESVEAPDWLTVLPDQLVSSPQPRPFGAPLVVTWQEIVESVA
jgi:uncharacterized protein